MTNLQCYRSAQRTIEYKIKNHFFSGAHIEFEEDFEEFGNIEQEMGKVIYSCLIRAYVQFSLRMKLLSFFLLYFLQILNNVSCSLTVFKVKPFCS